MMPSNSRSHSLTIMGDLSTNPTFRSVGTIGSRSIAAPFNAPSCIANHPMKEDLNTAPGLRIRVNPTTAGAAFLRPFLNYRSTRHYTAQDPNRSRFAGDNSMSPIAGCGRLVRGKINGTERMSA